MQDESGPPMPPPVGNNWEMFLEEQMAAGSSEVDLKTLVAGDRLVVGTKNTRYEFEWREDGAAQLSTDRADRPWGVVTIAGCAFRRSGVLAPGVLFRGGKLEYVSTNGQVRHRTTVISSLTLVRRPSPEDRRESVQTQTR
jgi:hypothetical protein